MIYCIGGDGKQDDSWGGEKWGGGGITQKRKRTHGHGQQQCGDAGGSGYKQTKW